ncbi:putative UvrD-like helicase [Bacillus phage Shanette]|uniref:DNA 3'-5' helicase n=1 Tax=Bacillus phage Shanette TaxID=1296656 RepID=S5M596_9CAUD|nr:DNA helicase [Bacillus phage Shanette]AGR47091.1 putative UvrD-like helicase [Bacillus phage Shanette]
MSKFIDGLNPSQETAVLAVEGRVQINAVAGSGKTRVLTHRVAHMITDLKIKPKHIMMTTFTKKASEEMEERLSKLIPQMKLMQLTIGTTHSIGYRILKKEYEALGDSRMWAFKKKDGVLMGNSQKYFAESIVKAIMMDRTIEFSIKEELRDMPIPGLLKVVGLTKNNGQNYQDFEEENSGKGTRMDCYIEFFRRYEITKQSQDKIDGDDMLYLLWKLLKEHPEVLKKYQDIYKYILVDEAQDSNSLQYELMSMLAYPENNLFIVGDDDQSMYGFRGAKPEQFIEFSSAYKNVQSIALEDNYRSNPAILQIANNLIKHNTKRIKKTLKAHKQDNSDCTALSVFRDETEEAKQVVDDIKIQIEKKGRGHKDIAILYRTNSQSRALEDELIMSGLPYVIHGGISFYERKEIKDIVSYLKLAIDPHADAAFKRVYNVPSRYLGKVFFEKVKSYDGSHWEAITSGKLSLKGYETNGILSFTAVVGELQELLHKDSTPTDLVNHLLDNAGYREYILGEDDEEESNRLENIETLKYVLDRYENVEDFLDYIEMMTSQAKHSIDGVQLMTIHKSKGLEFPVAFCVGVSEGVLPHFRAVESENDGKPLAIEEERRLLYVGITRAESEVYISCLQSYNGRRCMVSRFAKELGMSAFSAKKVNEEYQSRVLDPILKEQQEIMRGAVGE